MRHRFSNPYIRKIRRRPSDFIRWQLGYYDDILPPVRPPDHFSYPFPSLDLDSTKPKVTWINHCTFLIEVEGVTILTDPIWSGRCSPLFGIGPKRKHDPHIEIEDLSHVDIVLLSHNHYDHLDRKSVRRLHTRFPDIQWYVPKGVKKWFYKRKIFKVKELNWWEKAVYKAGKVGELIISAVPAQHYSGRGLFDTNKTLWMGTIVQTKGFNNLAKTLYFVGDTAYNPYDFKKIRERFPQIDLCLCPIGTYKPGRFMRTVHSSPEDAVNIHCDVKSNLSVGMHWKTFRLASEEMDQPPFDLYYEMSKRGLNPKKFLPLDPGVTINW